MLLTERSGSVLRVTLNRPEVRNAFNDELIAALSDTFSGLPDGVRVVVLSGAGKAFCAGGDLEWMRKAAAYTEEQNQADAMKLAGLFQAIATCRACVVAQVHGAVFGGGCGLVAAADVAVAQTGTQFAFSEARLGLIAATISPFVVGKIGAGHARALFSTAETFDTERALRIGLVHDVAEADALDAAVRTRIEAVLRCGPESVAMSKQLAFAGPRDLDGCAALLAQARAGAEGREGVAAFLEKRPASYVEEFDGHS